MSDLPNVDNLVAVYIKLRDERAKILREYEEKDDSLKSDMEVIEQHLLDVCRTINADQLGSKHGTVIRSIKTRYWTTDWSALHRFIIERKMPELLERRISQSVMKQLLEENPDAMPPGLNIDNRYSVTIRRKNNAA